MNKKRICNYLECRAELEVVEECAFFNKHLICPKCDSTYCMENEMELDWISVKDELPEDNTKPVLGYCESIIEIGTTWTGIVQVVFDREVGWRRCEKQNNPVRVLFWAEMPSVPGFFIKNKF